MRILFTRIEDVEIVLKERLFPISGYGIIIATLSASTGKVWSIT